MQIPSGMGESGETYLVGEDGLMRSDSRFFDTSSVLGTRVTGATVGKALKGEIGLEILDDYRGVLVYSAYRLFEFEGIRWAVLAEQDVAEIEDSIVSARLWMGGGFIALRCIALMLRFLSLHLALPASIAVLPGWRKTTTLERFMCREPGRNLSPQVYWSRSADIQFIELWTRKPGK
ncbi:MAG: hypothetical protein O7E57_18675 [Gammaproteobacteria bacterium]|nr:hypothetical protein [Gammaproteobacteria bacterium]